MTVADLCISVTHLCMTEANLCISEIPLLHTDWTLFHQKAEKDSTFIPTVNLYSFYF